ncbi:GDP-mannose 4,6-dehydratase [Candidatus Fermentibacteria bacterium]|nr:GDP-mannose 4,6-dehydratase [Candidatus Fermentibacteria bacterium]
MRNLVTGVAGFVGTNLAAELLARGEDVIGIDNLSRRGTEHNLKWLQGLDSRRFSFVQGDIRDAALLARIMPGNDAVFHLAAQVAVTTSITDPRADFEVNALGTLNVLEACRLQSSHPAVVFTSTNKVYGGLEQYEVVDSGDRWRIPSLPQGLTEDTLLDFHSPYGCSKGCADQYVRDYARIFGIPSVVFRMSCIYGPHQFGNEDQGWVMHFAASCLKRRPINVYGDGRQVRDILYVGDLVAALLRARDVAPSAPGLILNIGGGPSQAIPIQAVLDMASARGTPPVSVDYGPWRWGDQKVYISCIAKAKEVLGWRPQMGVDDGVEAIFRWAEHNLDLFP